jgi:hypothetical protein
VPDDKLIFIAEALEGTKFGQAPPGAPDAPPTLAAAIARILAVSKQATRGEILRAIEQNGLAYFSKGEDLYGTIGRALAGPQFARIHRGLYCLAADMPKPEDAALGEKARTTLMAARKLSQPFMARDVATQGNLSMPWVVVGLKELNKAGKVRVAEKLISGTARWEIVPG